MAGTVGITAHFYDEITCLMMMMIHKIQDMHRSENWAYTMLLLCFQHDTARFFLNMILPDFISFTEHTFQCW